MYRAWQISKSQGYAGKAHWVEILLNVSAGPQVHTVNVNRVTYHLMIEDERQYRLMESRMKGAVAFDPDAEIKAQYRSQNRDFVREMQKVRIVFK